MSLNRYEQRKVVTENTEPSLTKQNFKKKVDINNIMAKYNKTGLIDHVRQGGVFGDFSSVDDYHSALNTVKAADSAFATLSAELRKKFQNDPSQLIDFIQDPANKDEAIQLKLLAAEPPQHQITEPAPVAEPQKSSEGAE